MGIAIANDWDGRDVECDPGTTNRFGALVTTPASRGPDHEAPQRPPVPLTST